MAKRTIAFWMIGLLTPILFLGAMPGCSKDSSGPPPATDPECLSGGVTGTTPWTPTVSGVTPANHNSTNIQISKTTLGTVPATVIGLQQAAPASVEASVTFNITNPGPLGSFTLIGQVTGFPSSLQGSAFPLLVSLTDPNGAEYINLTRANANNDCRAAGYYTCANNQCSPNTSCFINLPSAYTDRVHWEQHQAPNNTATLSPSVNTFPTCNWTDGTIANGTAATGGALTNPGCPFTTAFGDSKTPWFHGGSNLVTGTYTARYVLVSDSFPTISGGVTAGISVTVVQKNNSSTSVGGAFDINFILVGDKNVSESRTAKGQQNLNTIVSNMLTFYNQTNSNLKFGSINAVEWSCAAGASEFAQLKVSDFNNMLVQSKTVAPAGSEGKAINLFLVGSIVDDADPNSDFTVLGYDGQINGPPINGTASSGVTASSFDEIATFNTSNASCTIAPPGICPVTQQDADGYRLSQVLTHELGHYLGLNHPSESNGTTHGGTPDPNNPQEHDIINDTNICTVADDVGDGNIILTINSCLNEDMNTLAGKKCSDTCHGYNASTGSYCPAAVECQFNDIMWWTVKNFTPGAATGDGNLFSLESGMLMNYSPLVQ